MGITLGTKRGDDREYLSLPNDLIIEILTKLPPRSLSKLICVSKVWSSLIQGEYFTDLYLTRSSTRPHLLFHVYSPKTHVSHYSSQENPSFADSITLPGYQVAPPVRGLICCIHYYFGMVIGNPSTGQFLTLPKLDVKITQVFFGYEPVNDLYKVFCLTSVMGHYGSMKLIGEEYRVLTLGVQESWRITECKYRNSPQTQGLCHNGIIYYGAWSNEKSVVVSFDLRFEEFSLITLPQDVQIYSFGHSGLVNYNGKIALVNISSDGRFDLWVMMNVKRQEWTKISVVIPLLGGDIFRCRGTIITGEVVFEQCHYDYYKFSLVYYNPKQGKARRVDTEISNDMRRSNFFLDHVESLIFLPRKFFADD